MDRLLGGKNPEWLYPFIALLIAVGAVRIVVEVLNAMYLLRLEGKMAVVSNSSFMWKVLHLPMEFFSQRMAGDLSARAATNTTIAASLVKQLAPLLLLLCLAIKLDSPGPVFFKQKRVGISRSTLDAGGSETGSGPGSASSVGRLSALSAGCSVSDAAAMLWLWLWRSWLTAEAA